MGRQPRASRLEPLTAEPQEDSVALTVRWAWWAHPVTALLLLTGTTALLTVATPADSFATWRVPKFLDGDHAAVLALGIIAFFVGIMFGTGRASRRGSTKITLSPTQLVAAQKVYRVLFCLTLVGYLFWTLNALRAGVGIANLTSVLDRNEGAIGDLKSQIRPVAGVTTLTQFGPVAVAIGFFLRRVGRGGRWFYLLMALAVLRTAFYAERLALIEVVVPILVIAAVTAKPGRRQRLTQAAPILAAPALWGLFALSEYTRSWVYYQATTAASFPEWVSLRLLGYYATSFNNSAILDNARPEVLPADPYFTFAALWDAPVLGSLLGPPTVGGMTAQDWWVSSLYRYGNVEFNNTGSFLVTFAELGLVGMVAFWLVAGVIIGAIFAALSRGSLPALVAYACIFVGILELPRFVYWTGGRATPVLLGIILLAIRMGQSRTAPQRAKGHR